MRLLSEWPLQAGIDVVSAVAEAQNITRYRVTFADSTGGRRAIVGITLDALTDLAGGAADLVGAARPH